MDRELERVLPLVEGKDIEKWYSCIAALYKNDKDYYKEVVRFRNFAGKLAKEGWETRKCLKYIEASYYMTARDKFDDFMLAMEWHRPKEQQFWLPRRSKLLKVCNLLQKLEDDELDELFISMPPRVGKSTLIMFFLDWVASRNSERSNLYCSFTGTVAGVFYDGLLELLQDPYTYEYEKCFDNKIVSTNAKELTFNLDRKKRYSTFTGRSIDGTLNGACDASGYTIADDLVSGIEEAMNVDRLNALWHKVDNDYITRGKAGTKRLWIGTRWSIVDPIGRRIDLLVNDPKYRSIRYEIINIPALDSNDESNFNYDYGVGFSTEYYQQRRASFERNNDMASWNAQYQGTPIEREGTLFAPDQMKFYNGVLPENDPDRIFMAIDPAWGGGDFVAGPICVQYGELIYVPDVIYNNSDKRVTQPLIVQKAMKHNVQAIAIEGTKTTSSYAEGVSSYFKDKEYRCNVTSSTKGWSINGKAQRIFDKAPDIREHMVFLESGRRTKEYEAFMNNVYSFKIIGENKNDDAPDSLAQAITNAFITPIKIEIANRIF